MLRGDVPTGCCRHTSRADGDDGDDADTMPESSAVGALSQSYVIGCVCFTLYCIVNGTEPDTEKDIRRVERRRLEANASAHPLASLASLAYEDWRDYALLGNCSA